MLPFLSDLIHTTILSLIMYWFVGKVIAPKPGFLYNPFLYFLIIVVIIWADFIVSCIMFNTIFGCYENPLNYSITYFILAVMMLVVGVINLVCALTLTRESPFDTDVDRASSSSDDLAHQKLKELLGTDRDKKLLRI